MSNRLYQSIIHQMKDAVNCRIGVVDETGTIISCSDLSKIGEVVSFPLTEAFSNNTSVTIGDSVYHSFGSPIHPEYAVFVENTDPVAQKYAAILAIALANVKQYYDEKYDRGNFIKNVLLDNILPGDVYVRAKELHFVTDVPRSVYLVRQLDRSDVAALEVIQNLFPDRQRDFVLSVSETDIVVIKELTREERPEDVIAVAENIENAVKSELLVKTVIGIGTTAYHLRELADRYKEAQVAIEVGKVFDTEKSIINYENLGIGRIIYQLPTTLCEMFLSEVFKKNPIEALDPDTLETINKFFENNLNVSETSRKLYVHRNTLVYRLEKIKKITGLDLREFDHAIVFKVAMMVKKYLDTQNTSKY